MKLLAFIGIIALATVFEPPWATAQQFAELPTAQIAQADQSKQEKARKALQESPEPRTKTPVTTGVKTQEPPKQMEEKPLLLLNPGPTYTFGLPLNNGQTRSLTLDQTITAAALTEKEVAEVTLGKDQHTLEISAKRAGATLLILKTADSDSILILLDVTASAKKVEEHRARFAQIHDVMTTTDAGRSASKSN